MTCEFGDLSAKLVHNRRAILAYEWFSIFSSRLMTTDRRPRQSSITPFFKRTITRFCRIPSPFMETSDRRIFGNVFSLSSETLNIAVRRKVLAGLFRVNFLQSLSRREFSTFWHVTTLVRREKFRTFSIAVEIRCPLGRWQFKRFSLPKRFQCFELNFFCSLNWERKHICSFVSLPISRRINIVLFRA